MPSGDELQARRCPVCKRRFYQSVAAERWGYSSRLSRKQNRIKKIVCLCSYKCLKAYEAPLLEANRRQMAEEFEMALYGTSRVEMKYNPRSEAARTWREAKEHAAGG